MMKMKIDLGGRYYLVGHRLTNMSASTKLLSKTVTKNYVPPFCFLKEATLSLLTNAVDIFHLLLSSTLVIAPRTTFWPSN